MRGSDAAVTANGPLMARDDGLRSPARGLSGTISPLARAFGLERVTRIELAWPAWKVARGVRMDACPDCAACPGVAVNDHVSPYLMAR
jgi:hypothetical protein